MSHVVKIVPFKGKKSGISEIYQPTGFHFSLVSEKDEQCHEMIKCRDFLQDAVRAAVMKNSCSIYGFEFDSAKNPLPDTKRTRLLVTQRGGIKDEDVFRNGLKVVRAFERHFKIAPKTKRFPTNIKHHYLFEGSADWVSSPFMISLYSFLIRIGAKKLKFISYKTLVEELKAFETSKTADNDIRYIISSTVAKIEKLVENRESLRFIKDGVIQNLGEKVQISSFHNQSGVVAFCTTNTGDPELNKKLKVLLSTEK